METGNNATSINGDILYSSSQPNSVRCYDVGTDGNVLRFCKDCHAVIESGEILCARCVRLMEAHAEITRLNLRIRALRLVITNCQEYADEEIRLGSHSAFCQIEADLRAALVADDLGNNTEQS